MIDTNKLQQLANDMVRENPSLRKGQSLMNALRILDNPCYYCVMGTAGADCFYDNRNIPGFWNAVYGWNLRVCGSIC